MCKAFSCLVTKSGRIYWKTGIDEHDSLWSMFKDRDKQLMEKSGLRREQQFARIEISPQNNNYLNPDKWVFRVDQETPNWLSDDHENKCRQAHKEWLKEVYNQINLEEARNPIHPFKIKPPRKIVKKHLELLREWASVRDSVGDSVWDSVWASVWDSVEASVGDSVWASVRDSVGDSVWGSTWDSVWDSTWAYVGSLFPKIKIWKYAEKIKAKGYPFNSVVKLWKLGLVPSFDGTNWRLHGGKDAKVLWEGKTEK